MVALLCLIKALIHVGNIKAICFVLFKIMRCEPAPVSYAFHIAEVWRVHERASYWLIGWRSVLRRKAFMLSWHNYCARICWSPKAKQARLLLTHGWNTIRKSKAAIWPGKQANKQNQIWKNTIANHFKSLLWPRWL